MSLIDNTILFVKQKLENAEAGHDWFHIERVYKNALLIAQDEVCDIQIVKLGALLHDIADSKFNDGDETVGPKVARAFLESQKVADEIIVHVVNIIENISFKGGNFEKKFNSIELEIVQDADRLDAIGAIGIARKTSIHGIILVSILCRMGWRIIVFSFQFSVFSFSFSFQFQFSVSVFSFSLK